MGFEGETRYQLWLRSSLLEVAVGRFLQVERDTQRAGRQLVTTSAEHAILIQMWQREEKGDCQELQGDIYLRMCVIAEIEMARFPGWLIRGKKQGGGKREKGMKPNYN